MGQSKTWRWIAVAIAALVTLGLAVTILSRVVTHSGDTATNTSGTPSTPKPPLGAQLTMPFAGLSGPQGIAANSAGDVYVADGDGRVVKLSAGGGSLPNCRLVKKVRLQWR
jgi:serine/threonine-protein kinase